MTPHGCPTCLGLLDRVRTAGAVVASLRTRLRARGCLGAHQCPTLDTLVAAWDDERRRVEWLESRVAHLEGRDVGPDVVARPGRGGV